MAVALSELQRRFFDRMDEGASQYITSAQATDVINEAYSLLWGIYTRKDPKYFETIATITPLINVRDYPLPTDFRRLNAAPYLLPTPGSSVATSTHIPMRRTMRDDYMGVPAVGTWYYPTGSYIPSYELMGSMFRINPTPVVAPTFTISIWYTPHYTPLVLTTDTLDPRIYPGHEQYVINQAVIQLKIGKEEQPADALMAQNGMLRQQIEDDLGERDMGTGKHIVETDCYDGWVGHGAFFPGVY